MVEVTRLLQAIEHGDGAAADQLLPLVYEDLRRLASLRMAAEAPGHTLQATALVHEAWLRIGGENHPWQNRRHFFAAAAEAMRRILIESARRRARLKRGGAAEHIPLSEAEVAENSAAQHVLEIDSALEQLALVDPQKAQVVTLKFFGGLTNDQVAEALGVGERTVERHWAFAKAWLYDAIARSRT